MVLPTTLTLVMPLRPPLWHESCVRWDRECLPTIPLSTSTVANLLDLRGAHDLSKELARDRCERTLKKMKPAMVLGSTLVHGGRTASADAARAAHDHLVFLCSVYRRQTQNQKWFLHEHPKNAPSWNSWAMRKFLSDHPDLGIVQTDLCGFELQGQDQEGDGYRQQPTFFITNMKRLAYALDVQCPGGHRHGGQPCRAAEFRPGMDPYPTRLVATLLGSLREELSARVSTANLEAGQRVDEPDPWLTKSSLLRGSSRRARPDAT